MENLTELLLGWGLVGLLIAAFTESFCSPILPDVVLIPIALAQPENAIYYGCVATAASIVGGVIGYAIGRRIGVSSARKMIPAKYEEKIRTVVDKNAKWAIFLAALSPIPYKFVSITAGALKIDFTVFMVASIVGRAKRFLLEGILIYYYGPRAVQIFSQHSDDILLIFLVVLVVAGVSIYVFKKVKKTDIKA
jgi:undecaprenyl-diphosphatase